MSEPSVIHLLGKNEPLVRTKERDGLFEGLHVKKRDTMASPPPRQSKPRRSQVSRPQKEKKQLTDEQLMYLRLLFDELDSKHTGYVLQSNYINTLITRNFCSSAIANHIPIQDIPKSLSELIRSLTPFAHLIREEVPQEDPRQPEISREKLNEYKRLFELLDKNCNGSVSEEELAQGLEYHSLRDVQEMVSKYDFDKNRELQFFEFVKMLAPEGARLPSNLEEEYRALD